VTESAYETGGFAPSLATSETLGMRGLSPDKAAELAQRQREFEAEQTRLNQPRYSLADGVVYQQEGEGAQAFNAGIAQAAQSKSADVSRAWSMLLSEPSPEEADNPDAMKAVEAQKQVIKEWLLAHDPDRAIKYFQNQMY
jgi:hypothetical protein